MGFDNEGNLEGFSRSMKDNMDWKVAPDGNDIKTVNAFQSAINELEENFSNRDKREKLHIAHMLFATFTYLSFIASIWLFVFDPSKWYAMIIFLLLSLVASTL